MAGLCYPLSSVNDSETFTKYDAINRPIAVRVFRAGQSDGFSGDPIFAPNPVSDPSNPSTTFPAVIGTNINNYQYDGLSRLTRATDNNDPTDTSDDSVVTYAYDSLSRVIEETQQIGSLPVQATSSAYDSDKRSSVTYPNGRKLVFTYDGLDRIKTITDDGASQAIAEYDYIGVGRVLERRYPTNGTRLTYLNDAGNADIGYDGLRRTVALRHLEADNTLIVGFEYGYDRMNDRTFQRKLHDPNNSELYSYDSSYRLLDFQRGTLNAQGDGITTPSTDASQGQEWNLDGVGNWDETIITDENGVNTTDNRDHSSFNELITQNGVTLRYDDNGNLVEDAEYLYQWDSRNRLRVATRKGDGVVAEYSYDAMGRRIIKDVSNSGALNGVTYFYHDGMREIEERDGSNVLKQQYVYGNYIDEVLVMDQNLNGDNSAIGVGDKGFYYHQDALFSVYAVTGETGQVAESYLYDPYGKVTVFDASGDPVPENAWGTANSAIGNPYLFTGRRFDEETGLYYYRARYFDDEQGRFISRDSIFTSVSDWLNPYAYTDQNPINWVDPLGTYGISGGISLPGVFRLRATLEIEKDKNEKDCCKATKHIYSEQVTTEKLVFYKATILGSAALDAKVGSVAGKGTFTIDQEERDINVFSLVERFQEIETKKCFKYQLDFILGETRSFLKSEHGELSIGASYQVVNGKVDASGSIEWQSNIKKSTKGFIILEGCCEPESARVHIEYGGLLGFNGHPQENIYTNTDPWIERGNGTLKYPGFNYFQRLTP